MKSERKKILFIDRDGTILLEPSDMQVDKIEKMAFLPFTINCLTQIAKKKDFLLVMVTNQDGLGTEAFPESDFWPAQNKMIEILEGEGIHFHEICIDKTFAIENKSTRKPGTGMLTHYLTEEFDLENSFVIGDRYTDIQLAKNLSARGILIGRSIDTIDDSKLDLAGLEDTLALKTDNWPDILNFLNNLNHRKAILNRKTKETDIKIEINLDGTGIPNCDTGISFFDHMLDQLAFHSGCDITINVKGDLHIDEHHTIEDTAIALGEAFLMALGNKIGINRYGFLLPMDDVLAQAAIDFSGRPWLVWDATFNREKIGEMPTEMFYHFWKSFSDAAKCNLNIKAEGTNEHHKIEAIFKAVAKSIKMAVKVSGDKLPSTKGVL
ncbi:MAG: bifunctional histidinol-phosphatase/imidazoleglycerol-phosphate dehydratase HisB [Bacteroidetes bacterium]|nr:bifunctional histidinol-phosphatase/imidazoleglycerol-phosphate dehydratase HisB [Bacteroidota bacterium]MBL0077835.1 bifunctional histidinol-phosphatase/imidazoleglycerol-phosphate dehydratase HisB [Bacteroidota bacterium]